MLKDSTFGMSGLHVWDLLFLLLLHHCLPAAVCESSPGFWEHREHLEHRCAAWCSPDSPSVTVGLVNRLSVSNKAFILNNPYCSEALDFMFVSEIKTWIFLILMNRVYQMLACHRYPANVATLRWFTRPSSPISRSAPSLMSPLNHRLWKMVFCTLIYHPPAPARPFLASFSDFLTSIIKWNKVILVGDLNLHVRDSLCSAASDFMSITETFNFTQHVLSLTHSTGHILSKDLTFSNHKCISFNLFFDAVCVSGGLLNYWQS